MAILQQLPPSCAALLLMEKYLSELFVYGYNSNYGKWGQLFVLLWRVIKGEGLV